METSAGFDTLTLLVSVVVGLVSGVIGAVIGAVTQRHLALQHRRNNAQDALWNYQRTMNDRAASLFEDADADESTVVFVSAHPSDLAKAREDAYKYREFLPKDGQSLIGENRVVRDDRDGPSATGEATDWARRAKQLEKILKEVFGRDKR
ncbi:hypothetical protein [Cryobacterium sp. TMT1-66-1]|uniref:hypothetical protein n=1 Tax=Cryobacterium sp. TMT1-66-1 TaxID=1259242 RepID=UPI0010691332|nr:hypothetical protein [Cryobacterium sp. TMT1-66-1]TFD09354.1 hypothetical protein E3T29_04185 [Cryobacterium sp. TMT1-66-1]